MAGKYAPLQEALRSAAERGQSVVDLGFDEVGRLVGGLPSSSAVRQWWANNSQVQALAWRAARLPRRAGVSRPPAGAVRPGREGRKLCRAGSKAGLSVPGPPGPSSPGTCRRSR